MKRGDCERSQCPFNSFHEGDAAVNGKAYRVLLLAAILCAAGGIFLKKNYVPDDDLAGVVSENVESPETAQTSEDLQEGENTETQQESQTEMQEKSQEKSQEKIQAEKDYIHWVDFQVSYEALCEAYEADQILHEKNVSADWINLLAVTAAESGGTFGKKEVNRIRELAASLSDGSTTLEKESLNLKYYDYYKEAYGAVLSQYVGDYVFLETDDAGNTTETEGYGLKAFSPIAKGFPYSDYDDFGASRSYGYNRPHLGHDMMGQTGTPIIAVESGLVECLGWNQYGGWRIGIRSFDKKRYYYYAHLRQNYPYAEGLQEGDTVAAGQVIGYMGHTGYSSQENVNNIDETHLHFGIQLIFDESQKEGNNEIWIDCYALVRFLYRNQSPVVKVGETREWISHKTLKQ